MRELEEKNSLFENQKEEYETLNSKEREDAEIFEGLRMKEQVAKQKEEDLLDKLQILDEKLINQEHKYKEVVSESTNFCKETKRKREGLEKELEKFHEISKEVEKYKKDIKDLKNNLFGLQHEFDQTVINKNEIISNLEEKLKAAKKRMLTLAVQISMGNQKMNLFRRRMRP